MKKLAVLVALGLMGSLYIGYAKSNENYYTLVRTSPFVSHLIPMANFNIEQSDKSYNKVNCELFSSLISHYNKVVYNNDIEYFCVKSDDKRIGN